MAGWGTEGGEQERKEDSTRLGSGRDLQDGAGSLRAKRAAGLDLESGVKEEGVAGRPTSLSQAQQLDCCAECPAGHGAGSSLTTRMQMFLSSGLKKPDVLGGAGSVTVAVDASVCV